MPSRPFLILGNMIAITVTIAAFAQTLSWTIAGILILVSLIIPLLVNIAPPRVQLTPHASSKAPNPGHHANPDTRLQDKPQEKNSLSTDWSATKPGTRSSSKQQPVRLLQPAHGPTVSSINSLQRSPPVVSAPRLPSLTEGPNLNPTIPKDDYMEYEVELEAGKDFLGEVTADGLVNVYLLDEENMDNLDEGEEFWSETGEEGVETAKLEFTAPEQGKWFFVVENADDRAVSAIVKLQKRTSTTSA